MKIPHPVFDAGTKELFGYSWLTFAVANASGSFSDMGCSVRMHPKKRNPAYSKEPKEGPNAPAVRILSDCGTLQIYLDVCG